MILTSLISRESATFNVNSNLLLMAFLDQAEPNCLVDDAHTKINDYSRVLAQLILSFQSFPID